MYIQTRQHEADFVSFFLVQDIPTQRYTTLRSIN